MLASPHIACVASPVNEIRSALLASFLVLPGTGLELLAHFSTAQHQVCPEHGLLVHAAEEPHTAFPRTPANTLTQAESNSVGHTHVHCSIACAMVAGDNNRRQAQDGLAVTERETLTPPLVPLGAVSILRTAPKGSPPA